MSEWWAGLAPRERKFVIAGAVALLLFVIVLAFSLGGGRPPQERVELTQAPPAAAPAPPATNLAPPPADSFMASPPPPPSQPASPAPGSYLLYGVSVGGPGGGAAILGPAGGAQRSVEVGRPVAGGMTLKEVGPGHAVLTGPAGDLRLELVSPQPSQAR